VFDSIYASVNKGAGNWRKWDAFLWELSGWIWVRDESQGVQKEWAIILKLQGMCNNMRFPSACGELLSSVYFWKPQHFIYVKDLSCGEAIPEAV